MTIETLQETDGRWIADVVELPGVMCYGSTEAEAVTAADALDAVQASAQRDAFRARLYDAPGE